MHGKWLILTIAFMSLALPDALPSTINLHSSFHISFKENINYYVVKFYSNQTIYIDEIHVKIEARRAGTQWFSTNKILIINFENNESLMAPEFYVMMGKWLEWYLQINIGKFNFTLNHLEEKIIDDYFVTYTLHNLSLPAGVWYLIVIKAPTVKCKITYNIDNN